MATGPADPWLAKKRPLTALFVVLLAGAAYLGFREWQTWRRLGADNDALKERLAQAQRQVKVDLPKAREQLADLQSEETEFGYLDRLPDEDRLEELFDHLSEFEQAAKVDWGRSTARDSKGARRTGVGTEPYEQIQYTLDLKGGLFEFVRFLNLVETMPRLARVDEFTLKSAAKPTAREEGAEEGPPILDISLVFSVFRLKSAPAPAPARPAAPQGRTARS
jgi:Tfp pilus assembly protein PilO